MFLTYPEWLSPFIFANLPFRWYGVTYLVAFVITFLLVEYRVKKEQLEVERDAVVGMFFWAILGLLIGGRLFAVLFYSPGGLYLRKPWLIFWPFQGGDFVGIQGMSYHGGLLGCSIGALMYIHFKRTGSKRNWADIVFSAVPLGYTFGRLGNFINAELYGRVTTSKIGMLFPNAPSLPTSEAWVRNAAAAVGIPIAEGVSAVNLPRHPSQLYEAFFEGVFLWVILWFVLYRFRPFKGAVTAGYLIGYGLFRFLIEYVRQPDEGIGFVLRLSDRINPIELFLTPLHISIGQMFCLLMIISGVVLWFIMRNLHKKESLLTQHNG